MKLVLASASPRRKELLELIGIDFEIKPGNTEEQLQEELEIGMAIEKIAYDKAAEIAAGLQGDYLVLGADTVVYINGKVLGKPKNEQDAIEMLSLLNNATHEVITAVAFIHVKDNNSSNHVSTNDKASPVVNTYKTFVSHQRTKVKIKNMDSQEIKGYVASGEPMGKAGSYAIQGLGVVLVEGIEGCYTNVVGLPVPLVVKTLKEEFGIRIL